MRYQWCQAACQISKRLEYFPNYTHLLNCEKIRRKFISRKTDHSSCKYGLPVTFMGRIWRPGDRLWTALPSNTEFILKIKPLKFHSFKFPRGQWVKGRNHAHGQRWCSIWGIALNRIWWLCVVPISTTRLTSDLGYRRAKPLIRLYKANTFYELLHSQKAGKCWQNSSSKNNKSHSYTGWLN